MCFYRDADKSLARPGRKQATATKPQILQATQKKKSEGCPSNQVSAAAMSSASEEKWRSFNCFFSRVGLRTYQHPVLLILVYHPEITCSKIQFMTNIVGINLLNVSTPTFHLQGVYQIDGIQGQYANLGMLRPHWNDQNIKILKYLELIDIKFHCLFYHKIFTSSTELFLQKSRILHTAITVAKGSDISASAVSQNFSFSFHVSGEKAQLLAGSHSRRGKFACLVFCS